MWLHFCRHISITNKSFIATNFSTAICFRFRFELKRQTSYRIIIYGGGTVASAPRFSEANCVHAWSSAWTNSRRGRNICHMPRNGTDARRCGCVNVWSDRIYRRRLGHRTNIRTVVLQCACERVVLDFPSNGRICHRMDMQIYGEEKNVGRNEEK